MSESGRSNDTDRVIERMELQFNEANRRGSRLVDASADVQIYSDRPDDGITVHLHSAHGSVERAWNNRAMVTGDSDQAADVSRRLAARIIRLSNQKKWRNDSPLRPYRDDLSSRLQSALVGKVADERKAKLRLDTDFVVGRLLLLFDERQAEIWMQSYNAVLNNRPVDALVFDRVAEIVNALEVEEHGSL